MKILEKPPVKKKRGVTILMNHQVFCTQQPTQADNLFIQQVVRWVSEYQKGNPSA